MIRKLVKWKISGRFPSHPRNPIRENFNSSNDSLSPNFSKNNSVKKSFHHTQQSPGSRFSKKCRIASFVRTIRFYPQHSFFLNSRKMIVSLKGYYFLDNHLKGRGSGRVLPLVNTESQHETPVSPRRFRSFRGDRGSSFVR